MLSTRRTRGNRVRASTRVEPIDGSGSDLSWMRARHFVTRRYGGAEGLLMSRSPTRARMAEAPGGLWHAPRSRELLRPERHLRDTDVDE
jgi:hypothetical protein